MKTRVLGASLILLVFLGGYFAYTAVTVPAKTAIPEIKKESAELVPEHVPAQSAPAQIAVFENTEYQFGFKFRVKPYGYSTFENSPEQNIDQGTLFGVTLMRSDDYNESVAAAAAGNAHDGLPAITASVFDAASVNDLRSWLVANRLATNCDEDAILATEIAGADALSCIWDGLYAGVTVARLEDNKIYLFTGTREGAETSDGYSYEKDFNALVESIWIGR